MTPSPSGRRPGWWSIGVVGSVAGAAVLRLLLLDRFPSGLHYDEAAYGLQAIELLRHPRLEVFFPAFTGREPLFIYLLAGAFQALGSSVFVLRLVAALLGIAAVAATALAGRALFGSPVGLLAAALLAGSFWHVVISRMAYRADLVPLIAPLAVWLLWRAWRNPSPGAAALAGAVWGLLAYTYVSVRLLPVALALFAIGELAAGPLRERRRLVAATVFLVVAAAITAPLLVHFSQHPADFANRFRQTATIASESDGPAARSLLGGVGDTLRMYGVRGDTLQKYNLPLRPALDPLLTAFFLIGVATALWRIGRSESRLALCWLIGSLAPGFITADSPNFLRLIGAAPPSYVVAALGMATVGRLAFRDRSRLAAALAGLLVLGEAVNTARDYFGDWAPSAATYYALDGDLADLGRLAALQPDGGALYASSEHYEHPTVAFTAGSAFDRLRWFDGRAALPIPAGPARYLVPRSARPVEPTLLGNMVNRRLDPDGQTSVEIYRRAAGAVPSAPSPVGLTFLADDGSPIADLVGFDAPADGRAGDTVRVATTWRLRRDAPRLALDFFAHAVDGDGRRWGQRDASPYLTAEWRAGESLLVWLDVPIDPTAPAGPFRVRLGLDDRGHNRALTTRRNDGTAGPADLLVGSVAITHAAARPPVELRERFQRTAPAGAALVEPVEADFGGARLLAAAFPPLLTAGDVAAVDLLWLARTDAPRGQAALVLRPSAGGPDRLLGLKSLEALDPTVPWLVGEPQRDVRFFAPTRDDVGRWTLVVRVDRAELALGDLEVSAPPADAGPVTPQRAANGDFGFARLVGFDVGDGLVRLYWQPLGPAAENYTVFVHALDGADHILAQNDAPPSGGARPTRGWAAGETIQDEHPLRLPPDARSIAVGLYDARTGQRVPLTGGGDRLVLPLG